MNYCHPSPHSLTPSPLHPFTRSPAHPLTLSPCHRVTLSPCHRLRIDQLAPVELLQLRAAALGFGDTQIGHGADDPGEELLLERPVVHIGRRVGEVDRVGYAVF